MKNKIKPKEVLKALAHCVNTMGRPCEEGCAPCPYDGKCTGGRLESDAFYCLLYYRSERMRLLTGIQAMREKVDSFPYGKLTKDQVKMMLDAIQEDTK